MPKLYTTSLNLYIILSILKLVLLRINNSSQVMFEAIIWTCFLKCNPFFFTWSHFLYNLSFPFHLSLLCTNPLNTVGIFEIFWKKVFVDSCCMVNTYFAFKCQAAFFSWKWPHCNWNLNNFGQKNFIITPFWPVWQGTVFPKNGPRSFSLFEDISIFL